VVKLEGVNKVKVEITWEPPWTQDKISESAKLDLGLI
jgi:metal-sulfur cluster biosynthetic enzyme